ncbi:MAG: DNA-binding protein [Clostridia bacterium]|nr:DNA-binding protein [Clostridia bacterium]
MFEKNLLIPCLLDIYGELLTERKHELLDYYYEEDYSLSEISELTGISRQGVRDSLRKSAAELVEYESKLRLYEKKTALRELIEQTRETLSLVTETDENKVLVASVATRLDALEELL